MIMETNTIKELLNSKKEHQKISLKGWIVTNRGNSKIRFLSLNDGSTISNLQIVADANLDLDAIDKWKVGSAIWVEGNLVLTPNAQQPCELKATKMINLAQTDDSFPIQKQEINLETLREIPHVRHRTNILRATMLIRSTLAKEIHNFFASENFLYMHSPIITSNDGEGAGEAFNVTMDDPKENFFGNKKATLAVTGQLQAESYALGFQKVYTFGPTFRAEKSNTKRHAAEFWMIEPEVAFYQLQDVVQLANRMLKFVINNTLKQHPDEFNFLDQKTDGQLLKNLNQFLNQELQVLDYADAIKILQQANVKFENNKIEFGIDLATEHEKYLTDIHFKAPVAVINYPKEIKAFYMHLNDDNQTVAAFDLLVPGIGELIGGSQREVNIDKLIERMHYYNINIEEMQWYLDLRKFGNAGSAGFGLGFERLVMYVTGIENIRDAIPYPRTFGSLKM